MQNYLEKLDLPDTQPEFKDAVNEVFNDIVVDEFQNDNSLNDGELFEILKRLSMPDRLIKFKVEWFDDQGVLQINNGWRVQMNNSIGPYKGGLRFHTSVNESILKFLAFEQTFKNALTDLPMGGAKGGSDFNPKGKSDSEIRSFCKSFMTELLPFIGSGKDIPAGDIGVGEREIGYLYGQYVKINNNHSGILTGKGLDFGGSQIRAEATGYGCAYILDRALSVHDNDLKNKKVLVSGSGNVALYCAEKLLDLGAKVLTLSDSSGTLLFDNGLNKQSLDTIKKAKFQERRRLSDLNLKDTEYFKDETPWRHKADIAVPCATQNEVNKKDVEMLIDNGLIAVAEGANMPLTASAQDYVLDKNLIFIPAKAANAGGVAVSMIEKNQNATFRTFSEKRVKDELVSIMNQIHDNCIKFVDRIDGVYPYKKGANLYAFKKVSSALISLNGKTNSHKKEK